MDTEYDKYVSVRQHIRKQIDFVYSTYDYELNLSFNLAKIFLENFDSIKSVLYNREDWAEFKQSLYLAILLIKEQSEANHIVDNINWDNMKKLLEAIIKP